MSRSARSRSLARWATLFALALPVSLSTDSEASVAPADGSSSAAHGPDAVAPTNCTLDLGAGWHDCAGAISVVMPPAGDAAVLRIDLTGFSGARFDVHHDRPPSGWTVNIGDSNSNNGYGGDGASQSHDAELQVVGGNLAVYASDQGGSRQLLSLPDFARSGSQVSLVVKDQHLEYTDADGHAGALDSPDLYALAGQRDVEGAANCDLYAAFNRTIGSAHRAGRGAGRVTVTLLTGPAACDGAQVKYAHAYYLFLAGGCASSEGSSVPLLLTSQGLEQIADGAQERRAALVTTWERDSVLWVERSIALLPADIRSPERQVRVQAGLLTLEQRDKTVERPGQGCWHRYQEIGLHEARRLIEHPNGSIPVHRMGVPRETLDALLTALPGAERQAPDPSPAPGLDRGSAQASELTGRWVLRQERAAGQDSVRACSKVDLVQSGVELSGVVMSGTLDGGPELPLPAFDGRPGLPRTWADMRCSGNVADTSLLTLSCRAGAPEVVEFRGERAVNEGHFTGEWRRGAVAGRFSLEKDGAACPAEFQVVRDNKVLWQRPQLQFDEGLKARVERRATVGDLLRVLGPGHVPDLSSTGTITWTFRDGASCGSLLYPQSLGEQVACTWW